MIWLAIILAFICFFALPYLFQPNPMWDGLIWPYYAAPIEADVRDATVDGITESYNPIDTTTYGIILVLAVFGIYRLLKRLKVKPGKDLVFATVPYILLGGVMRALEDSGMFTGRTAYLTIAPMIYILIGLLTILKLVEAHDIQKLDRSGPGGRKKAVLLFAGIHAVWNILYTIGYFFYMDERELFSTGSQNAAYLLNPAVSVFLSLAAIVALLICIKRRGRANIHDTYAIFGWHWFVLALFHALAFMVHGGRWPGSPLGTGVEMNIPQLILVPVLAYLVLGLFILCCYVLQKRFGWLDVFWRPVNLLIMYAHLFDASATFTALQFFSYGEKHVLPNFLIQATGTPCVMFPLKLIIMAFVVYVLDIELKKDLKKDRLLKTLVWVAIIVLGLAPGTRDLMRLVMGV